jgi:hypothetical protein
MVHTVRVVPFRCEPGTLITAIGSLCVLALPTGVYYQPTSSDGQTFGVSDLGYDGSRLRCPQIDRESCKAAPCCLRGS